MNGKVKKIICLISCIILLLGLTFASAEWQLSGNGRWWYSLGESDYIHSDWLNEGYSWYFFDSDGWMVTGWKLINQKWFYFNSDGRMKTGWIFDGGNWYYCSSYGAMVTDWQLINGYWYFFESSGKLVTDDWRFINGHWYFFESTGRMVTGTRTINNKTYYFDENGRWVENNVAESITVHSLHVKDTIVGPELYIRFKNNLKVAVDRVDFYVDYFDVYGDRVYGYGYYNRDDSCLTKTIPAGGVSSSDLCWEAYGYDTAKTFIITVYKYHTVSGETVEIPTNQQISNSFRK